jgi:N-acetylglucosaminyl-diphospho-decaprenol L-rhamnosyltransferase
MKSPSTEPDRSSSADVIAIVVSYNSADDLPACLASLNAQRGVSLRVHVVDNASSDQSAERVRREFPWAQLTANDRNVGFARANNQVLETEIADDYALVNPDAVVPPDAVTTCVRYLREHPDAGVVATRLISPDGTLQPSTHSFLSLWNLFGETLGLDHLLPRLRLVSSLHMPWFGHDRIAEVDWLAGAFLVIRGEVVRSVGAFDPSFFMYGEEMDWCKRIRNAGWSIVFLPEPDVVHAGGRSSDADAGPMFVENLKGRVRFMDKHHRGASAALARTLIAGSVLLRWAWSEARLLAARLIGRSPAPESLRHQARFRHARRWLIEGMPMEARTRTEAG